VIADNDGQPSGSTLTNATSYLHFPTFSCIYPDNLVYTELMAKHLIDLDEDALGAAQAELGTTTIKDTVNGALQRATAERQQRVSSALDMLAEADLDDRSEAWR
jgi:Arc/MetJ family transcription regulator